MRRRESAYGERQKFATTASNPAKQRTIRANLHGVRLYRRQ